MSDSVFYSVCAAALIITVIISKISGARHCIRSALLSMMCGILALTAVNICSFFTGVSLPVSRLSLLISAFLGLPGVVSMLVLQLIL